MQSIDDKILSKVRKCGRGTMFSSADFTNSGEPKSVLKALERMANAGTIIRVARGIYCYPKIEKTLGLGAIYPTFEEYPNRSIKENEVLLIVSPQVYISETYPLVMHIRTPPVPTFGIR